MREAADRCVYLHMDPAGAPFYVGMGEVKRAFVRHGRNSLWKDHVSKLNGRYTVFIFDSGLTATGAAQLEKECIAHFGLSNLTNKSIGGQHAALGMKHSEESKRKISDNSASRRPEFKKRLRDVMGGSGNPMFGRTHSVSARRKIAERRKDRTIYMFVGHGCVIRATRETFRCLTGCSVQTVYNVVKCNGSHKGWKRYHG